MHETHEVFYMGDGALGCRSCCVCVCHMPNESASPCPNQPNRSE